MRRVRGTGSISLRTTDQMWIAYVDLGGTPRKRKTFSSKDRAVAEQKLADWMAENRPGMAEVDPYGRRGRAHHMAEARKGGTHTAKDWATKRRQQGNRCFYCKRDVGHGGMKDHYVPVAKGGSDSIDNIVLACFDCNTTKSDAMPQDFIEWAEDVGFYDEPKRPASVTARGMRYSPDVVAAMKAPPGERWDVLQRRLALRRAAQN